MENKKSCMLLLIKLLLISFFMTACISAPTQNDKLEATDEISAIVKLQTALACCEIGSHRDVANLTLDLLHINSAFLADDRLGEVNAATYKSVLAQTYGGPKLLHSMENIFNVTNDAHPILSRDQLILLRSAVYLAGTNNDLGFDSYILARAAELAGDLSLEKLADDKEGKRSIFVLPFYVLAYNQASNQIGKEDKRFDSIRASTMAKIRSNFGIRADSTRYFFETTTLPTTEASLRRRVVENTKTISAAENDTLKGTYLVNLYALSYNLAALTVIDTNNDSNPPFEQLLSIDPSHLSKYGKWVTLLDLADEVEKVYRDYLIAIRSTAVEPTEDPNYRMITLKLRQAYLNPTTEQLLKSTAELFHSLQHVPPGLRQRLSILGKW